MTKGKLSVVVVTGAGGFIGGSLVSALHSQGFKRIRAVDVKPIDEWYQRTDDVANATDSLLATSILVVSIRRHSMN